MTTPYVLLPYQASWLADDSQVKVWAKSRRIGASWVEACDAVLTASAEDGTNVLYSGYNKPMAQTWIADAADWARHFGIAPEIGEELWPGKDDGRQSIRNFYIQFRSGHRIQALSSRPNNMRGLQGNIVIDEAGFVESLDEMLKSALALLMWGGRLRILSTFNGENAFYDLVENVRKGKLPYSLHFTTLDDALQAGLYERICLVSGKPWTLEAQHAWRAELMAQYGDAALEELLCIPASGSGSYISRQIIEAAMIDGPPLLRLSMTDEALTQRQIDRQIDVDNWLADYVNAHLDALPRHLKHYCGLDFGRSGDLSSLVLLTELENLSYRTPFILEMRNVMFELQRQIVFHVLGRTPHLQAGIFDASGSGAYLGEVAAQQFGDKIVALKLTENHYRDSMPKLKDWLENKRLLIVKHTDVMRDLRAIELIRGIPRVDPAKRHTGSDGKQRHADTAVALCLAVYAASGALAPAAGALDNSDRARVQQRQERARRGSPWRGR